MCIYKKKKNFLPYNSFFFYATPICAMVGERKGIVLCRDKPCVETCTLFFLKTKNKKEAREME